MQSQTAYEALYTYIGLSLHELSIQLISSETFFRGILLLILAISFIITIWKFFSKYMPSSLFGKLSSVSATQFIKILACFFISMAILKVDTPTTVTDYKKVSWNTNKYISTRLPQIEESYKVSFLFKLLTNTADQVSTFFSSIVDKLFISSNSQMKSPDFFYKAIMHGGVQLIDDSNLRIKIENYTNYCFEHIIHQFNNNFSNQELSVFFSPNGKVDQELRKIRIDSDKDLTCFDLKSEIRESLELYAERKLNKVGRHIPDHSGKFSLFNSSSYKNYLLSKSLVNFYLENFENRLGLNNDAIPQGTFSKIQLYWSKLKSFDGLMHLFGQGQAGGSVLTAQRAKQFSEYLQRAPHIKGVIKLILIFIFPWLIFFIVAGRWKVLVVWFLLYASVSLWTPIWMFFYHLTTHLALSTELMTSFGKLNDGISLLGANLISEKLYQYYAIYTWLQIIVGPLPTLLVGYFGINALLRDSSEETTPEVVQDSVKVTKSLL